MRSVTFITPLLAGLLLAGCAATSETLETEVEHEITTETNEDLGEYRYGVERVDHGRSGAAYLQPDHEHVLHYAKTVLEEGDYSDWPTEDEVAEDEVRSGEAVDRDEKPASAEDEDYGSAEDSPAWVERDIDNGEATDPLRRAWERYCDAGHSMTEEDWSLIEQAGGVDSIPEDLLADCQPPK